MRPIMPAFVTFGRLLFAVLFIVSGASKLFDLAGTADLIAGKVVIPATLTAYTSQLESITGMEMKQMLAIAGGGLELICGLMIALNFGTRFFSLLLILFVIAVTFYFHDFWNQTGLEAKNNMIHALKNLSIIGALFIIAGIGRATRVADAAYTDV
jgi:putative oxidoreductase